MTDKSGKKSFMKRMSWFSLFGILLIACITVLMVWKWKFQVLNAYFIGVNIILFLYYGLDKFLAVRGERKENPTRIPEKTLHWMAFLLGTPGAFLGQKVFRHKTVKKSFRVKFYLILFAQILLIYFWYYYQK